MRRQIRLLMCLTILATVTVLTSLAQHTATTAPATAPTPSLSAIARIFSRIPQGAPEIEQGQHLFEAHCASCHGPRGEGGRGPTLAQPKLPRATDDGALLRIIRNGIGGTEMPGGRLDPQDVT